MRRIATRPRGDSRPGAGDLRPSTRLATGRAALGALLVSLAALGVLAAWRGASTPPSTTYLVAATDLAPGDAIDDDDVRAVPIDLPDGVAKRALRSTEQVAGSVALAPLAGGDLLLSSALLLPSAAVDDAEGRTAYEVSLSIGRSRAVGGSLVAGESVDVLVTYGTGPDAWSTVLDHGALVTDVDDGGGDGLTAGDSLVVTIALESADAVLEAVHAQEAGAVTLVRATRSDPPESLGDGPPVVRSTPPTTSPTPSGGPTTPPAPGATP